MRAAVFYVSKTFELGSGMLIFFIVLSYIAFLFYFLIPAKIRVAMGENCSNERDTKMGSALRPTVFLLYIINLLMI